MPTLESIAPTPVFDQARISFSIPTADVVELRVLDVAGREVARLLDGSLPAGHHELLWSRSSLVPGTYFLQLRAGKYTPVLRTVVL